jgi:hypothetical protein
MSQPRTSGEKQILSALLDQQRDVVLWKLDGLTDDQLRQPWGVMLEFVSFPNCRKYTGNRDQLLWSPAA